MAKKKIVVEGVEIHIINKGDTEYISLTDMARSSAQSTDVVIQNWMRNADTIEFLSLWETEKNPNFKPLDFGGFNGRPGQNRFYISPKQWIQKTNSIGIETKSGRGGGTYAHRDIAFEFGTWLSPSFKLYLIVEFQKLKNLESATTGIEWDMRRTWVKANHRIHTEAIRENIVPLIHHHTKREGLYFASEVDMLNKVVFGMTAKEWRMANTDKKGNMRDQASVEQLVVLANMENLNADYISMGLSREERYTRLTTISAHQLSVFAGNSAIKALKKLYKKK